jgi:hypothetical protein
VVFRIEEIQAREGVVEQGAYVGIDSCPVRLTRELLLGHAFVKRAVSGLALFGRDALCVEID